MRRKKGRQATDRGPLAPHQQELAEQFVPLAQRLARPLQMSWPCANDEFESAAMFALIEAAQTYKDDRGVKFATFARHRIMGALRDVQREQLPRGWRSLDPGTLPHVGQLDERVSLFSNPVNRVFDDRVGEALEQRDSFEHWLRRLPARHAEAMRELYLHDHTQFEAAARLGCSQSRLSSLHAEAVQILNGTWGSNPTPRSRGKAKGKDSGNPGARAKDKSKGNAADSAARARRDPAGAPAASKRRTSARRTLRSN